MSIFSKNKTLSTIELITSPIQVDERTAVQLAGTFLNRMLLDVLQVYDFSGNNVPLSNLSINADFDELIKKDLVASPFDIALNLVLGVGGYYSRVFFSGLEVITESQKIETEENKNYISFTKSNGTQEKVPVKKSAYLKSRDAQSKKVIELCFYLISLTFENVLKTTKMNNKPILQVEGLTQNLASADGNTAKELIEQLKETFKSMVNSESGIIIDKNSQFSYITADIDGSQKMLDFAITILSITLGIPKTVLSGEQQKGLGNGGDYDLERYETTLNSIRGELDSIFKILEIQYTKKMTMAPEKVVGHLNAINLMSESYAKSIDDEFIENYISQVFGYYKK